MNLDEKLDLVIGVCVDELKKAQMTNPTVKRAELLKKWESEKIAK